MKLAIDKNLVDEVNDVMSEGAIMLEAMRHRITELEAKLAEAKQELGYIANAKRNGFTDGEGMFDGSEFMAWAQNRARHTITRLEAASGEGKGSDERSV